MLEEFGDLWSIEADVRCITTNGTVLLSGKNIMGGGCALEARDRFPWLPGVYGSMIRLHGNHAFLIGNLVMFPVKETVTEKADLDLIYRSFYELTNLVDVYEWDRIAVPRPGCGLGGLSWEEEVRPLLLGEIGLDDRFVIVHFAPSTDQKEKP